MLYEITVPSTQHTSACVAICVPRCRSYISFLIEFGNEMQIHEFVALAMALIWSLWKLENLFRSSFYGAIEEGGARNCCRKCRETSRSKLQTLITHYAEETKHRVAVLVDGTTLYFHFKLRDAICTNLLERGKCIHLILRILNSSSNGIMRDVPYERMKS